MIGQISASLAAMHRTVEDYDSMAKREIIKAKQEKAMMCVYPVFIGELQLTSLFLMIKASCEIPNRLQ